MRMMTTLALAGVLAVAAQPALALQDARAQRSRAMLEELRAAQRAQLEAQQLQQREMENLLRHYQSIEAEKLQARLEAEHAAIAEYQARVQTERAGHVELEHAHALMQAELEAQRRELEAIEELRAAELLSDLMAHSPGLDASSFQAALDRLVGDGPRAAHLPQDPADSLWRRGRELFNSGEYRDAARMFSRIRTESRFERSAYRIDAHYWEAFALSRLGGERDLEQARDLLRAVKSYPPTQRTRDAEGLLVTVEARLARLGDRDAERALVTRATEDPVVVASRVGDAVVISDARGVQAIDVGRITADAQQISAVAQDVAIRAADIAAMNGVWLFPTSYGLPRQCRTDENEIRMVALNALARLDAQTALPVLREVMVRRGECTEYLRRQALSVAARQRTPEATQLIADAARNDPDSSVRTAALQLLVQLDEELALSMIEERLRAGSDTSAMREAISALGSRNQSERAIRILRDVATQPTLPTGLRRDAIRSLGRHDDADTRRALRALYMQTSDEEIKQAILSAASTSDVESVDWLLQIAMASSETDGMRRRALSMAGRNRAMTTDRLAMVYDRLQEQSLKRSVVSLLASRARNDSAATDKLLSIARSETDIEIRKAAIMALASSNDPRARDLLLDILRR